MNSEPTNEKYGLRKRIIAGIGANAYAQITNIAIQLLSLPVFLHAWSAEKYGTWQMLTALPVALAFADAGLLSGASNRVLIEYAAGRHKEASKILSTAVMATTIVLTIVAAIMATCLLNSNIQGLHSSNASGTLVNIILACCITLLYGIPDILFKASNNYAKSVFLQNHIRLLEFLVIAGTINYSPTFFAASLSTLICRGLGLLALAFYAWQARPHGLTLCPSLYSQITLRELIRPGIHYLAFPASNILSHQGFTLVIGAILGPAAVTTANIYKTISRTLTQATGMYSNALAPEFSNLYGKKDKTAIKWIYDRYQRYTLFLIMFGAVVLLIAAPYIVKYLTHDRIIYSDALLLSALIGAVATSTNSLAKNLLISTGHHENSARQLISLTLVAVVFAAVGANIAGIIGAFVLSGLVEMVITAESIRLTRKVLSYPISD